MACGSSTPAESLVGLFISGFVARLTAAEAEKIESIYIYDPSPASYIYIYIYIIWLIIGVATLTHENGII